MTTTVWHTVQHVRAGENFVARCACGWESAPSISVDGLGSRCAAEADAEERRDFAVIRTPLGVARTYQLNARAGTALLIATRGLQGTPAVLQKTGGPVRLLLEDGRSFIVTQPTCDQCCATVPDQGVRDGKGHVFCDGGCRSLYQGRN